MKKIFTLLFILLAAIQCCYADEETIDEINSYFVEEAEQSAPLQGHVEYEQDTEDKNAIDLDSINVNHINISKPKSFGSKSMVAGMKKPSLTPIQEDYATAASKFSTQEYSIRPVSTTYSQKYGKLSFGAMYNSSLDSSAQSNYSTGIFTRYDWKYFALSTSYSKSTNSSYDSYNDKIFVAPELKLTKRLSLLDIMQTDVNQINKKNEVVLRYTPSFKKYADDIQFEIGAGQSFYEDNYINSSVRFSTRFKL